MKIWIGNFSWLCLENMHTKQDYKHCRADGKS